VVSELNKKPQKLKTSDLLKICVLLFGNTVFEKKPVDLGSS
jgi:hypothetical protein